MNSKEANEKEEKRSILNKALEGAAAERVSRFGSAAKEHFAAYSGRDNETGKVFKGLKRISEEKTNPQFYNQNIKQQAGFSAEVLKTADENAKHIIKGDKNIRAVRTDDMQRQHTSDGTPIGGVNEELFDFAEIDEFGKYIENTGLQLKFIGSNGKECADLLMGKKFDKYRDNNVPIAIPSDYLAKANSRLDKQIEKLPGQIEHARKAGDFELAAQHEKQLQRAIKTKSLLRDSGVTRTEAINARLHPKLETAKNTVKIANQAGIQQAGYRGCNIRFNFSHKKCCRLYQR